MAPEPTFYAIYDADGSFMGEVRYLRDKCLGKADCALCDLSHGWNPLGRSDWRRRKGVAASSTGCIAMSYLDTWQLMSGANFPVSRWTAAAR